MLDIVGRLKPELWGIWSSLGGRESVMDGLEANGMLGGERKECQYFNVEGVRGIRR